MNRIILYNEVSDINQRLKTKDQRLKTKDQRLVLVGGCFDILHSGHTAFLEKAKAPGDILIVLLESDAMIRQRKGSDRPVNTQQVRAKVLSKLPTVNYIILLPQHMENKDYDDLVIMLKPAIIATTAGDPGRVHKERQASLIGAQVVDVIDRIPNQSTTLLVQSLPQK